MSGEVMDIHTPPGDKVIFTGVGGYDWDKEVARECGLEMGKMYTVELIDIDRWKSTVFLKEVPQRGFNTVMFRNMPRHPYDRDFDV